MDGGGGVEIGLATYQLLLAPKDQMMFCKRHQWILLPGRLPCIFPSNRQIDKEIFSYTFNEVWECIMKRSILFFG